MNKKQLQEEVEKVSKGAIRTFKKDGYLSSIVFLLTLYSDESKGLGVIPLYPEMLPHRAEILRQAGFEASSHPKVKDIEAIVMISEVFLGSPIKKGQKAVIPSQDPKAKDGIIIAGMTQAGEQMVNIFEITKKKWWKRKSLKRTHRDIKSKDIKMNLLTEFWKSYRQVNTA